jgi:hypothetical protein
VLEPQLITTSAQGAIESSAAFSLADGDSAMVDFPQLADATSGVRDWFLVVDGKPVGYQPSAAAMRTHRAPSVEPAEAPIQFRLIGSVPNPVALSAHILFQLPTASYVRLEIFDMQGRRVRSLSGEFAAGQQALVWDRMTKDGSLAPRGTYSVRLSASGHSANGRLTVR